MLLKACFIPAPFIPNTTSPIYVTPAFQPCSLSPRNWPHCACSPNIFGLMSVIHVRHHGLCYDVPSPYAAASWVIASSWFVTPSEKWITVDRGKTMHCCNANVAFLSISTFIACSLVIPDVYHIESLIYFPNHCDHSTVYPPVVTISRLENPTPYITSMSPI